VGAEALEEPRGDQEMKKMSQMVGLVSVAMLAAGASADVLWDQSQINGQAGGAPNTISGSPPFGSTIYAYNDIAVGGGGWTVNSISVYFSALGFDDWTQVVTSARLNIFTNAGGALPSAGDNPGLGPNAQIVDVSVTAGSFDAGPGFGLQQMYIVTASGLNINLAAGDYWIGLTPLAPSGFFGPETNWAAASVYGQNTALWSRYADPLGGIPGQTWFGSGTEAAILIQGVPTPGAGALIGVAALAGLRRRR